MSFLFFVLLLFTDFVKVLLNRHEHEMKGKLHNIFEIMPKYQA